MFINIKFSKTTPFWVGIGYKKWNFLLTNYMKNINSRPVMLISNSSWYLYHYRKLLIENLKKENEHILALAPYDSMSRDL